jgi:mRNA interferase HigB
LNIITRRKINQYCELYKPAAQPLRAWYYQVREERWENPADIRQAYNSADFIDGHRVIFNIMGNQYQLVIDVFYAYGKNNGTVLVRWFGNHKEYNQINVRNLK